MVQTIGMESPLNKGSFDPILVLSPRIRLCLVHYEATAASQSSYNRSEGK